MENTKKSNTDHFEEGCRFTIIYSRKIKNSSFIFNRSTSLDSTIGVRLTRVLNALDPDIKNNRLNQIFKEGLTSSDTNVLEIISVPNFNHRDQKYINQIKEKWAKEIGGVVRYDAIDDDEILSGDNINVIKGLIEKWLRDLSDAMFAYRAEFRRADLIELESEIKMKKQELKTIKESLRYVNEEKQNVHKNFLEYNKILQGKIGNVMEYLKRQSGKLERKEIELIDYSTEELRKDMREKTFKYLKFAEECIENYYINK